MQYYSPSGILHGKFAVQLLQRFLAFEQLNEMGKLLQTSVVDKDEQVWALREYLFTSILIFTQIVKIVQIMEF